MNWIKQRFCEAQVTNDKNDKVDRYSKRKMGSKLPEQNAICVKLTTIAGLTDFQIPRREPIGKFQLELHHKDRNRCGNLLAEIVDVPQFWTPIPPKLFQHRGPSIV